MDKPSALDSEDINFIVNQIESLENTEEKYKYVFNWLVENYSYKGYNLRTHTLGLWMFKFDLAPSIKDDYFGNIFFNTPPLKRPAYTTVVEQWREDFWFYWANQPQSEYDKFKELCQNENDIKRLELVKENAKRISLDYILDKADQKARDEFLSENPTKYCGVCVNFSSEFCKVCKQAGLNPIAVDGEIFNGFINVPHEFNAVQIKGEVKFIDISAAIHVKEQNMGLYTNQTTSNPEDYFLCSFDELHKLDGNDKRVLEEYSKRKINEVYNTDTGRVSL